MMDAPWVDLTDALMAGQMVAEKGASMVVEKVVEKVVGTVAWSVDR